MQPRVRQRVAALLLALLVALAAGSAAAEDEPALAPEAPSPPPVASAADLDAALERLAKQEFDLDRALEATRLDLESAKRRFEAAQQRLDLSAEPDERLREEVAARRLRLSVEQRILSLLEERLARVQEEGRTWRRLHRLAADRVPPETLTDWAVTADEAVETLRRQASVKSGRLEEVRQELSFLREQREGLPASDPRLRWIAEQERALRDLESHYEEETASLATARQLQERLALEVDRASEALPLSARLRGLVHKVRAAWNYELTGSEREPITPGKIVSAVLIFLVGWGVARMIAHLLGSRLFARMRLDRGAATAFQSLAFYVLLLVAFLTALRMVQIPLTAFAVVGGALAIGVGFGSQNVVNNFISGIILLAERPIKLDDLIEIEGVYGSVERIGLRSTRVRTGDNFHIIVPNATFLESNVINWTHTDPKVRVKIGVGVVYGSPTREVERLIRVALKEHPAVLDEPEPVVLFKDFGDDSLVFETLFWIEMRTVLARLRVESDLRFRIDDLFREAGIVIAFPQRDVHLDAGAPLDVRLVEGGDDDEGDRGAGSAREA